MIYCMRDGAAWVRVGANTVVGELRLSQRWLQGLTDEERAELGVAALVETARPAGVKVLAETTEDVDGAPTQVWETEPYTTEEVADIAAAKVQAVKDEASRRILARYPLWRQNNMNMRASALNDIRFDRELTTEEAAERADLQSAAAWISDVRSASDAIEAALPEDVADLVTFDAAQAAGWPEEA